jgi:hypothetical protein
MERRNVMKRFMLVVLATLALALGLSSPASAATANPTASCPGLVGASLASQPGSRAVIARSFIAEAQSEGGTPGALQSEWARLDQSLCVEFITP